MSLTEIVEAQSFEELRRLGGLAEVAYVQGANSAGDGGGGLYRWVSGSRLDSAPTSIASYVRQDVFRWLRIDNLSLGYGIRSYGAVGNNITNDTVSIQAAVDAAQAAGGGTVTASPGQYLVAGGVAVPSNVKLAPAPGAIFTGVGSITFDRAENLLALSSRFIQS